MLNFSYTVSFANKVCSKCCLVISQSKFVQFEIYNTFSP